MRKLLLLGGLFGAVIVATVAIAFYTQLSSGGNPENLRALEADPIARYAPPGGRLIRRRESEDEVVLGKRQRAQISRQFELPRGAAQTAVAEATRAARATGWRAYGSVAGAFLAEKRLSTGVARLTIRLSEDPVDPPPGTRIPTLRIALTHS